LSPRKASRVTTTVYTIGHSNQTLESFLLALRTHSITAVADVRSYPYSNANPQFDRETLVEALEAARIAYVYLGKELGARTDDPGCYVDGKVQYDRLAQTKSFEKGLARVQRGMEKYQVALMCAEGEPLACHRAILVSRYLHESGLAVKHILRDASLEDHEASMARLTRLLDLDDNHFFRDQSEVISEAYRIQGEKIAYKSTTPDQELRSVAKGR
jgi:uncharacterized protein (DUF488 family)